MKSLLKVGGGLLSILICLTSCEKTEDTEKESEDEVNKQKTVELVGTWKNLNQSRIWIFNSDNTICTSEDGRSDKGEGRYLKTNNNIAFVLRWSNPTFDCSYAALLQSSGQIKVIYLKNDGTSETFYLTKIDNNTKIIVPNLLISSSIIGSWKNESQPRVWAFSGEGNISSIQSDRSDKGFGSFIGSNTNICFTLNWENPSFKCSYAATKLSDGRLKCIYLHEDGSSQTFFLVKN